MVVMNESADRLVARLKAGEVAALARAISLVDSHAPIGKVIHQAIHPCAGHAQVVGITGPPGVGKSTLIDALVVNLRQQEKRVAVVAIDPSSPITGGSVLGDRIRMGRHVDDPGVFIRSLSARGHLGGLSANILRVVDLIDAAGWDLILLETVGAGQSETEVFEVADINVVVNAPGLGDEIQAIKSGILEIADLLVVNKADSPLAQHAERQLKAMLQLRKKEAQQIPVLSTIATKGTGIDQLSREITGRFEAKMRSGKQNRLMDRTRRMVAQCAAEQVKQLVMDDDRELALELYRAVARGDIGYERVIRTLLLHYYHDSQTGPADGKGVKP